MTKKPTDLTIFNLYLDNLPDDVTPREAERVVAKKLGLTPREVYDAVRRQQDRHWKAYCKRSGAFKNR